MGSLPSDIIVQLAYVLAPLAFIGGWLMRERRTQRGGRAFDAQWANESRVHHELRRLGAAAPVRALGEPVRPRAWMDSDPETARELGEPPWPPPPARPLRAPWPPHSEDAEHAAATDLAPASEHEDDGLPPLPPPVRVRSSANEEADAQFDATALATWPDSVRGTTLDPARRGPTPPAANAFTRLAARSVAVVVLIGLGWAAGRAIWPVDSGRLGNRATRALSSLPGAPEPALAADLPPAATADQTPAAAPRGSRAGVPQTATAPAPSPSVVIPATGPNDDTRAPKTAEISPLARATSLMPDVPATTPTTSVGSAEAAAARVSMPSPAIVAARPTPGIDGLVEVKAAQLCTSLTTGKDGWRCVAAQESASEGTFYFYTRLRATRATKVRHLWYRDDEVRRSAELTLAVSGPEGYRTYSRMPIAATDVGTWRVELRDEADRLLHEARLLVR